MRRARPTNLRAPVLGASEVGALLGWSPNKVSVYAARGALPQPLAWLKSGPIWRRTDIVAYAAGRRESPEPTPEPKPAPKAEPVRFSSQHGNLTIFSGPHGPIRFHGGRFETTDPYEIAFLRAYAARSPEVREDLPTPL